MASSLTLVCLVVVALGFLYCSSAQILPANDKERQICEDNANNRTVRDAKKNRRMDCEVVCTYDDGNKEKYNSPDQQDCCDVGGLPTGNCKDGECVLYINQ